MALYGPPPLINGVGVQGWLDLDRLEPARARAGGGLPGRELDLEDVLSAAPERAKYLSLLYTPPYNP
jgi:hypothetical protein